MIFFLSFCVITRLLASTVKGQEETPGCGDISLSGPEGTFTSPNYPGRYPDDLFCVWRITTPKPYQKIKLTVDYSIEVESTCGYDAFEVYDGPTNTSELVAVLCGTSENLIRSSGNELFVVFRTDNSISFRGFTANYEAVDCLYGVNELDELEFSDKPKTSPTNLQNAIADSGAVYKGKSAKNVIFDIGLRFSDEQKHFSIVSDSGTITTRFASVVRFGFILVSFDNDGEEVFQEEVLQVPIENSGKWTTTKFDKPDKKMVKLTIALTWDNSLTKKKEKKIQVKDMEVGACYL